MSLVMTETLQESTTRYHLKSSTDQYTPLEVLKSKSRRSIPLIRVRESATGGSEFVDDEIPLDVFHALGDLSSKLDVAALQFRFTNSDYGCFQNAKPHNAPARQFVITLNGTCVLTVIDKFADGTTQRGESRVLRAGDLLFVEDVAGTGHYACNGLGTTERFSLFLPVGDRELVFGSTG